MSRYCKFKLTFFTEEVRNHDEEGDDLTERRCKPRSEGAKPEPEIEDEEDVAEHVEGAANKGGNGGEDWLAVIANEGGCGGAQGEGGNGDRDGARVVERRVKDLAASTEEVKDFLHKEVARYADDGGGDGGEAHRQGEKFVGGAFVASAAPIVEHNGATHASENAEDEHTGPQRADARDGGGADGTHVVPHGDYIDRGIDGRDERASEGGSEEGEVELIDVGL